MANYSAGTASVDIKPNFDGFVRKLREDLDRVQAELGVEIKPDTAGFAQALQAELDRIAAKFGVEIEPDTSGFAQQLSAELSAINAELAVDITVSDASLVAAEQKIRDRLDGMTVTVDVDADTSAAAIALETLRATFSRMSMDVEANTTAAGLQLEALRAAHETHTMDVDADTTAAAAQLAALQSSLNSGGRSGGGLGLGSPLMLNAAALGVSALPAAANVVASIGADVQALSANIALLPALIGGAVVSFATLSVGLDGLKDAFGDNPKKAAEAYAKMGQEGREVVDTAKSFGAQWKDIRKEVQETTLMNLAQPLKELMTNQLPVVKAGMTGLADQFNTIGRSALTELGNDKSTAALGTIFGNTSEAAGKLNGAVVPIINSIRTLATTGSSFMPRLAESFTKVAEKFDAFIARSERSGDLWQWMDRGLDSASKLGSIIGNLGSSLSSLFRARRGEGETFLTTVDRLTERMANWMKSTEGQASMRTFFQEGADQLERWKPILGSIGSFLKTAYEAAQAWSGILLPFLTAAAGLLTSHEGLLRTVLIGYLAFKTIGPIFGLLQGAIVGAGNALSTFQAGMANSSASSAMGKALGGLGAVLGSGGIFGIALIGATIGLGLLATEHQKAANAAAEQRRQLQLLKGTLDEQSGAITEQTRRTVAEDLTERGVFERAQSFGYTNQQFLDAGLGTDVAGRNQINARLTQSILEDEAVGGSWWSLAQSQTGLSDTEIAQALQGVPEALEKYRQAAGDSGVTLAELKRQLGDTAESAATLGGELNGTTTKLGEARNEWEQTNAALHGTFALTEEGKAKFAELGVAVLDVPNDKTVTVQTNSPEQIQALKDLGYEIKVLPNGVVTIVLSDDDARSGIYQITKPETKVVNVVLSGNTGGQIGTQGTAAAPGQDQPTQAPESYPRGEDGRRLPGRALGGPITGGTPGQDSVPILAMPGEHMLTTSDVDKLGGQSGVYRFRAALQAGLVKPMAKGGAVEWTDEDENKLQQAVVAVTQAQEKADKVAADPKASAADKEQAQLKVQQAQIKANKLQAEKDGTASAASVAPQAALPGRASSDELSRADAEAAVDQANAKRNQIYNDPKSTDDQKRAADRDYQKAQNSLEDLNNSSKSSSDSGLPEEYTAQGIGSAVGEAIATGILSFFGLENSIFSSSNTYNRALNTAIDYYSGDGSTSLSSSGDYSYVPKEVELEDSTSSSSSSSDGSSSSSSEVNYSADGGVEQWRGTFSDVLTALAMPASWLSLGLAQMQTESGGNPKAINNWDSNAANGTPSKGLMQVIDPTFASYRSAKYPNDIWDPSANIAASLLYTQARYGSPVGVWGQGKGYAAGGWITGGIPGLDSVPIVGMPDEFVVNAQAARANAPLLEAINAGNVPSLPAGFGSAITSTTSAPSTTRDQSVHYHGDFNVMNPEELFRQQDRHVEQQTVGTLAAF